jgi:hypothetical protein
MKNEEKNTFTSLYSRTILYTTPSHQWPSSIRSYKQQTWQIAHPTVLLLTASKGAARKSGFKIIRVKRKMRVG